MSEPSITFLDTLPESCSVLRDYQRRQLDALRKHVRAGKRRILMQGATGSGKTHGIAAIAACAYDAGLRVAIIATRTRLVRQIHERLDQFSVTHGVIAAQLRGMLDRFQTVQVASADTLYRRAIVDARMPMPPADIVIFDECHLAGADSRARLLAEYPDALHIGFSATPATRSGRPLSALFDCIELGPTVEQLIELKMLVRPRVYSIPVVTAGELEAVARDTAGDYATGAASALMSRPPLIGDVLQNWLRVAAGKRTLIFACDKAHGAHLVQQFQSAGIAAELLTDQDSEDAREAAIARLESGQTAVLVNCFLLSYGIDIPSVECIVLARPTRSLVMYLQSVGRGMRPAPGKDSCIIIDHGRVIEALGMPTDAFHWTLDEKRNANRDAFEARASKTQDERPRTCPECKLMWIVSSEGPACPGCGWLPTPVARPVRFSDAELHEVGARQSDALTPRSPDVVRFFTEALGEYIRTKPQKWRASPNTARAASWYATKERFALPEQRVPSTYWNLAPTPPSASTAGWLMHRRIKYARSRSAA